MRLLQLLLSFARGLKFGSYGLHHKVLKVDVAVGTIVGAHAAADAPVFDDDFQRALAPDGAHRTADHAKRVAALPAGSGDEVFIELQAVTDEPGDAGVGIGTGAYTLVAARAAF